MVREVTAGWDVRLIFEPGRVIVGNAGILLASVIRVKPGVANPFVVVDAAMNDLLRPSLYDAWHDVRAIAPRGGALHRPHRRPDLRERRHLRPQSRHGPGRGR
jgi:diaminopimelate decarboxylase